jgi:hypothetical protein
MQYAAPITLFAAWITTLLMSWLNPTNTVAAGPIDGRVVIILAFGSIAALLLPFSLWKVTRHRRFYTVFAGSFALLLILTWWAANNFHRDFFSFGTQVVMIYFIIFLNRIDSLGIVTNKQSVYPPISVGSIVAFALWTSWIMLMSYAIVTRTEPRWIESIAYNLVNGVIALLLLLSAGLIHRQSRRTVRVESGVIHLDDRNISELLSPQESLIAALFLTAPHRTLTCRQLVRMMSGRRDWSTTTDCERCLNDRWTASDCSTYRNIKNRIGDTRKYLELLQIGAIVPASENPRDIKETGWCLRLFDDVRLEGASRRASPSAAGDLPHVRK